MYAAPILPQPSARRRWLGRRPLAFALVLLVHLLLVALLILLAPSLPPPTGEREATVVRLLPAPVPAAEPKVKRTEGARSKKTRPSPVPPKPVPPPPKDPPLGTVLFDAFDIASVPSQRAPVEASDGAGNTGAGRDAVSTAGGAVGPDGAPMYQAEWQREPTDAELSFYVKDRASPGSWALIACKTVDRFRVDDCRELDEFPRGSGLSRAVREAAWQFRVLPPRIGGRALTGAWVSIRIDFSREEGR